MAIWLFGGEGRAPNLKTPSLKPLQDFLTDHLGFIATEAANPVLVQAAWGRSMRVQYGSRKEQ